MEWTPIAIASGLMVNALVVAFGFGGLYQRVKTLEGQEIEDKGTVRANRKDMEGKINDKSHLMLPECMITFQNLGNELSKLEGKVDALIVMIKNGK